MACFHWKILYLCRFFGNKKKGLLDLNVFKGYLHVLCGSIPNYCPNNCPWIRLAWWWPRKCHCSLHSSASSTNETSFYNSHLFVLETPNFNQMATSGNLFSQLHSCCVFPPSFARNERKSSVRDNG